MKQCLWTGPVLSLRILLLFLDRPSPVPTDSVFVFGQARCCPYGFCFRFRTGQALSLQILFSFSDRSSPVPTVATCYIQAGRARPIPSRIQSEAEIPKSKQQPLNLVTWQPRNHLTNQQINKSTNQLNNFYCLYTMAFIFMPAPTEANIIWSPGAIWWPFISPLIIMS
jgi:hypothetical protein